MTSVTIQLSEQEIKALKARTGKRNVEAALKGSLKEEAAGKGKHFRSGREAIRWLAS